MDDESFFCSAIKFFIELDDLGALFWPFQSIAPSMKRSFDMESPYHFSNVFKALPCRLASRTDGSFP